MSDLEIDFMNIKIILWVNVNYYLVKYLMNLIKIMNLILNLFNKVL